MQRSTQLDDRGVALLELALIAPLLLLLFVGTLEFARTIRIRQAIDSFTRELTKTVARNCRSEIKSYEEDGNAMNGALLSGCLSRYSGSTKITLGSESLDVDVLASVYSWDSVNSTPVAAGFSSGPPGCSLDVGAGITIACSAKPSKLSPRTVEAVHGSALRSARDLVFIESFVGLNPIIDRALQALGVGYPDIYTAGVA